MPNKPAPDNPASDNVVHFRRANAAEPNRHPAGMTKPAPQSATFWTWLGGCLIEGFAFYGASVYPPALYPFDLNQSDARDRPPAESPPAFPKAIVDQED
jgi:hypothetical protein